MLAAAYQKVIDNKRHSDTKYNEDNKSDVSHICLQFICVATESSVI